MSWWFRLLHRDRLETQLEKELRFHLDERIVDYIERGHDRATALRFARLELGGIDQSKEECRDARGTRWLEDFFQDLLYAARQLRQKTGFAALSITTLALGIGATTAIFSAINPIMLQPLPYPHANRIMSIWYVGNNGQRSFQSFGNYREMAARTHAFENIAVFKAWQPTMTGAAEPERIDGQRVSADYFRVLGIQPALGRDFDPSDDRLRGPNVVMLSDSLWRRRFSADSTIAGRQITLNDTLFTVVGIMPAGFENVLSPTAEIWAPLQYDASLPATGREWGHHLQMAGRLRPGIRVERARQDLEDIARTRVPEFTRPPWSLMKNGVMVSALQDDVTRGVKPALLAVMGAVILLLVIACVNVTHLLLARSAQRRGELAMRAALGARRGRLIRQLITESLLLALAGAAAGILVADLGVRALVALAPSELPRVHAIVIDGPVFLFAFCVATLIGVLVGLIPALQVSREELHTGLHATSRRATGNHQWTRRGLVVAEVSLALVLLVSAGLLLRSLQRLFSVAPGFDASHVVTLQVQVSSPHRYSNDAAVHRFFDEALAAVKRVPGVASAAFTNMLPLAGDKVQGIYGGKFEHDSDPNDDHAAYLYTITPDFQQTMRIPLVRGRLFDANDTQPSPARPVLINESFAKRRFSNANPIGERMRYGGSDTRPWDVIVGVVGDVKQTSLAAGVENAFYVVTDQWLWADNPMSLVVRARGDAAALVPQIRNAIWSVDKDQPIVGVTTMDALLLKSEAERRFSMILFEAFALVALLLAAIGIYGVLSGSVTERTREIGVRAALGASRGDIVGLVVRQAMLLTGLGAVLGLLGAAAATKAIAILLFGISRLDLFTYSAVVVLLIGVAAVACWIPAWRAARVDPAITLRTE